MEHPTFDDRDRQILEMRQAAFNSRPGPRVGDFLKTDTGFLRFTYDWDDSIQTTCRPCESGESGSFYLDDGWASYSGSLDHAIPKTDLQATPELKTGRFWFFHHNFPQAYNGVDVQIPCRVFEVKHASS